MDYQEARDRLEATTKISSKDVRRERIAELQTSALIDIAVSLNVLAIEASLAMPRELDTTAEEGVRLDALDYNRLDPYVFDGGDPRDWLAPGDIVYVIDGDGPAEVLSTGIDQDEVFAALRFPDAREERFWIRNLERLHGGTPEPEMTTLADATDDIDADFDGDTHDAATSALDKLRELEAKPKRKTTKK